MTVGVDKLSQEQLISSMIVKALRKNNVIAPTLIDLSDQFSKGKLKAAIPSAGALSVESTPRGGAAVVGSNRAYDNSPMVIDQHKTVADYIYDLDDEESTLDLMADFYSDAPGALADNFETDIVNVMRVAGAASSHAFELAGDDGDITLDQLGELNEAMTTANVPKDNRYLAVSPRQARVLRGYPEVRNASAIGTNDALVNGFVARLEGFTILESNDLLAREVLAYHGSTAAYGIAKQVKKDEQREASKKRTFCSVDSGWGRKAVRDLIWHGTGVAAP